MSRKMEKGGGSDGHPGRSACGGAVRPHLELPGPTSAPLGCNRLSNCLTDLRSYKYAPRLHLKGVEVE